MIGRANSPDECVNLVLTKQSVANGATWDVNNEECFAEFSLSNIEPDEDSPYQSCIFTGKLSSISKNEIRLGIISIKISILY